MAIPMSESRACVDLALKDHTDATAPLDIQVDGRPITQLQPGKIVDRVIRQLYSALPARKAPWINVREAMCLELNCSDSAVHVDHKGCRLTDSVSKEAGLCEMPYTDHSDSSDTEMSEECTSDAEMKEDSTSNTQTYEDSTSDAEITGELLPLHLNRKETFVEQPCSCAYRPNLPGILCELCGVLRTNAGTSPFLTTQASLPRGKTESCDVSSPEDHGYFPPSPKKYKKRRQQSLRQCQQILPSGRSPSRTRVKTQESLQMARNHMDEVESCESCTIEENGRESTTVHTNVSDGIQVLGNSVDDTDGADFEQRSDVDIDGILQGSRVSHEEQWPAIEMSRGWKSLEAARILSKPPLDKICTSVPQQCMKSLSFVVDTSKLKHPNCITADNTGKYRKPTCSKTGLVVRNNGFRMAKSDTPEHILKRRYYYHHEGTAKRIVYVLIPQNETQKCELVPQDKTQKYALLQYLHEDGVMEQGKALVHRKALMPRKEKISQGVKNLPKSDPPHTAASASHEGMGDAANMQSLTTPKDVQQAKNAKLDLSDAHRSQNGVKRWLNQPGVLSGVDPVIISDPVGPSFAGCKSPQRDGQCVRFIEPNEQLSQHVHAVTESKGTLPDCPCLISAQSHGSGNFIETVRPFCWRAGRKRRKERKGEKTWSSNGVGEVNELNSTSLDRSCHTRLAEQSTGIKAADRHSLAALTADQRARQNSQPFSITFCHGLIKRCYGCNGPFSEKIKNCEQSSDLILRKHDFREYEVNGKMHRSNDLVPTFYHLSARCMRFKYPCAQVKDISLGKGVREMLQPGHVRLLHEFGFHKV